LVRVNKKKEKKKKVEKKVKKNGGSLGGVTSEKGRCGGKKERKADPVVKVETSGEWKRNREGGGKNGLREGKLGIRRK